MPSAVVAYLLLLSGWMHSVGIHVRKMNASPSGDITFLSFKAYAVGKETTILLRHHSQLMDLCFRVSFSLILV